jgi:hypothetical protein
MKELGYSEIVEQIENAPLTWIGGLLLTAAKVCQKKGFFKDDDALLRTVKRALETNDKIES